MLEQLGEHSLLLLGRKWWRFKYSCWFEIDTLELEILVRKILMAPEAGLQGCHLKKGLIREIIDYLIVALFVDPARYSTPCFLPVGESAERWICFRNVLVNIDELAVKPPEKCETRVRDNRFFGMQDVEFDFDPAADCPKWKASLEKILPDSEIRKSFQQVCGYALSRSTKFNKFALCFGPAGTGKSSVLEILRKLVGEKNCAAIPFHDLGSKFYGSELTGKWANIVEELADDSRNLAQAENFLKIATSGGMVKTEKKFQDVGRGRCRAFNLFGGNTVLNFSDRSKGLWDRIILIPFENVIRGTADQNKDIVSEWMTELSGIFNWAMEGLRELADEEYFPLPPVLEQLIDRERERCDAEGSFLRDFLVKGTGTDVVPASVIFHGYRQYANQMALPEQTQSALYAVLLQNFPWARKSHTTIKGRDVTIFRGVALRSSQPLPFYPGTPPPSLIETANGRLEVR